MRSLTPHPPARIERLCVAAEQVEEFAYRGVTPRECLQAAGRPWPLSARHEPDWRDVQLVLAGVWADLEMGRQARQAERHRRAYRQGRAAS